MRRNSHRYRTGAVRHDVESRTFECVDDVRFPEITAQVRSNRFDVQFQSAKTRFEAFEHVAPGDYANFFELS